MSPTLPSRRPAPLRPDLVATVWMPWVDLIETERDVELIRLVDAGAHFSEIAIWMGVAHESGDVALRLRRARERVALQHAMRAPRRAVQVEPEPKPTQAPEVAPAPIVEDAAPDKAEPAAAEPRQLPREEMEPTDTEIPGPRMQLMWVVLDRNSTPLFATSVLDHAIEQLADAWRTQITGEGATP